MQFYHTARFRRAFNDTPAPIQRAFLKQARFLLRNLQHSSLHAKKYDARLGIWQARVTKGWRFYFTVEKDIYYLLDIIPHP
jgi:mRNA interferase RelE/StbE